MQAKQDLSESFYNAMLILNVRRAKIVKLKPSYWNNIND